MAYTAGWNVVAFEQPTAAKWNQLGANDDSFHDGTGIDTGAISTDKLSNNSVTAGKIAAGVTALGNYSSSEILTSYTWLDGKSIYKKTINFGSLPNTTTKNVAHGITNLDYVVRIDCMTKNGTTYIPLPYSNSSALNSSMYAAIVGSNIEIGTGQDRTAYSAYVTIYYTKTS